MATTDINLDKIIHGIEPVDGKWIEKARKRTAQLLMPARALGRLHDISECLCGIQKTLKPSIERKAFLVMAGDHGVVSLEVFSFDNLSTSLTFLEKHWKNPDI